MAGLVENNPDDMAELADKLGHAVEQINHITSSLSAKAEHVKWEGPDARRFKLTDWPQSKDALTRVTQDLEAVKVVVNKQRRQQL